MKYWSGLNVTNTFPSLLSLSLSLSLSGEMPIWSWDGSGRPCHLGTFKRFPPLFPAPKEFLPAGFFLKKRHMLFPHKNLGQTTFFTLCKAGSYCLCKVAPHEIHTPPSSPSFSLKILFGNTATLAAKEK